MFPSWPKMCYGNLDEKKKILFYISKTTQSPENPENQELNNNVLISTNWCPGYQKGVSRPFDYLN